MGQSSWIFLVSCRHVAVDSRLKLLMLTLLTGLADKDQGFAMAKSYFHQCDELVVVSAIKHATAGMIQCLCVQAGANFRKGLTFVCTKTDVRLYHSAKNQ
jgi:hypothetical protein